MSGEAFTAKAGPAEELKHMQEAHEANDGSPPEPGDQRRAMPCARRQPLPRPPLCSSKVSPRPPAAAVMYCTREEMKAARIPLE